MELDILDENLLSRPGDTLVEIETDSEDSDCENKEPSDGVQAKIKIPDIIQSIEAKFSVKPSFSSRPFFNGDDVCFRPEKSCKWMRGKIEMTLDTSLFLALSLGMGGLSFAGLSALGPQCPPTHCRRGNRCCAVISFRRRRRCPRSC